MENELPVELYQTIINNVPIVCVDVIPIRKQGATWQIGVITRATGPESGKLALIGGRIRRNELIDEAINRHLLQDIQITSYKLAPINTAARPFYIQQYLHQRSAQPPLGYDPAKHSVALTYLITITEAPQPRNEASAFQWIDSSSVPAQAAFNQQIVMNEAFISVKL